MASGPRVLLSSASTTMPIASRSGFAFSSSTSATTRMLASRPSSPSRVFADTGASGVSPPHSSTTTPLSDSSFFTRSGFAFGTSILFSATTIGTPAAFAWSMASFVCGMTPSSAATTSTATSVTCAPRARMAVNASWPGVSRNVIGWSLTTTWYAPMCCVMPPCSVAVTFDSRIASSRLVLPWSTWPMIVTTGGRFWSFDSSSSIVGRPVARSTATSACSAWCASTASNPMSVATIAAVSKSMTWLIEAMTPFFMSSLMTSTGDTAMRSPSSLTERTRGISSVLVSVFVVVIYLRFVRGSPRRRIPWRGLSARVPLPIPYREPSAHSVPPSL